MDMAPVVKFTQMNDEPPPNLADINIDLQNLVKYLELQELRPKTREINLNPIWLAWCREYIAELLKITTIAVKLQELFGLEIFLVEFESLFRDIIEKIKLSTDDYSVDLQTADNVLLSDLLNKLEAFSYIHIDLDGSCNTNTEFIKSTPIKLDDIPISELDKYLNVGDVLRTDVNTNMLISELGRLNLETSSVSPYLTIVGPSLMGKTQSAFTLSHMINVIYVNFMTILESDNDIQLIYSLFEGLTQIFEQCIVKDISNPLYKPTMGQAERIQKLRYPFRTLGLIYVMMRIYHLRGDMNTKDRLIEIIKIGNTMIPCLTIEDFILKSGDLKNHLVFIDEMPVAEDGSVIDNIKFLRNLCRVVKLPCLISGTNSKINNLIGRRKTYCSRTAGYTPKPWVQVMVKTPNASVKSFCQLVQLKHHQGQVCNLESYISESDVNDLDYDRIFNDVFGNNAIPDKIASFKKLLRFLVCQSRSSLPGMIPLFLNYFFQLLPLYKDDPKKLWAVLNEFAVKYLSERKETLKLEEGLLASAHILVFSSSPLKKEIEKGKFSATLVENHLFRYGAKDEITFRLHLKSTSSKAGVQLFRDGSRYKHKCNFPEVYEDFFTTFLCLNMWKFADITNDEIRREGGLGIITLAGIYQEYLLECPNYLIETCKSQPDSISLEILSHWSICQASHQNLNGETGGKAVFTEFVKQLQPYDSEGDPVQISGLTDLPASLESVLFKIKVPYLMRFPVNGSDEIRKNLEAALGDFVKLGNSYIPPNRLGLDIVFDLDFETDSSTGTNTSTDPKKNTSLGFIECKLWSQAIGYSVFFDYYKKACVDKYPLSFFVCKEIRNNLDLTSEVAEEAEVAEVAKVAHEPINPTVLKAATTRVVRSVSKKVPITTESPKPAKITKATVSSKAKISMVIETPKPAEASPTTATTTTNAIQEQVKVRPRKDYIKMLNELWTSPDNHIDIYAVEYEQTHLLNRFQAKYTVKALKTFANPKGAFVLVESKFDPPNLASFK